LPESIPLILSGELNPDSLKNKVAVVTGAGRGIGFETARALAWLGAYVIIAEVDRDTGSRAAEEINREIGKDAACFIMTDVGDISSIQKMASRVLEEKGTVDIIVNNATVTPLGAVQDVSIEEWDLSYRVNLQGPVVLAKTFLPGMLERNYGVFACVSSVGEAYMGAYESLKAAQTHLGSTLDAELEGTGVIVFTIGPGLVHTPGALAGIEKLAPLYDKTVEEFFEMSKEQVISAEGAGAGFAAAVALAERFRGMEIDSRSALAAAGISLPEEENLKEAEPGEVSLTEVIELCREVRKTIYEQHQGWLNRPIFERQWMLRNFKKVAGMPAEHWLDLLDKMEQALEEGNFGKAAALQAPLNKLASFYKNLQQLARGYVKDPAELEKNLQITRQWQEDAEKLAATFQ
jgi:NAD(P)-dependent dehydrogenase (short-subunit alcohol dehydrogenase family)